MCVTALGHSVFLVTYNATLPVLHVITLAKASRSLYHDNQTIERYEGAVTCEYNRQQTTSDNDPFVDSIRVESLVPFFVLLPTAATKLAEKNVEFKSLT
jgi:hypothetical protein